jgi:hypothetical protein
MEGVPTLQAQYSVYFWSETESLSFRRPSSTRTADNIN